MNSRQEVSLEQLLKEEKISQRTYDKVSIAKKYIERKYNLKNTKNSEWNAIIEKIDSLNLPEIEKEKLKKDLYEKEAIKNRKKREKLSIHDYESLSIIGRGAFGEVHVCREKKTGDIVAIKKIKKEVLIQKKQIMHTRNEQQFLSNVKSNWTVELKASFQEDDYLYLVMEYLPGGDLMNLLIKKDILTESEARFYIAELILAIEEIHKLDCIHRDIKPDNVLIGKNGHIKLSDFGLAKISDKIFEKVDGNIPSPRNEESKSHQKNYSCVGTAYYVAPEVLNKKGYGQEIDWWSVGAIFFEMLIGYAPFCSKDTNEVCYKILNWQKYLKIPQKIKISSEAEDLIKKLINNSSVRLGKRGAEEIKAHPFFKGLNWENIRNTKAPFIPQLKNDYDVSYFETFETKEPFYPPKAKHKKRKDIEYIGYTFKEGEENENQYLDFLSTMEFLDNLKHHSESNQTKAKTNSSTSYNNSDNTINMTCPTELISPSTTTIPNPKASTNKLQVIPLPLKKIKIDCSKKLNLSSRNVIPNNRPINNFTVNMNNMNKGNSHKNIIRPLRLSPSPKKPNILDLLNSQMSVKNVLKKSNGNKSLNKSASGSSLKNQKKINNKNISTSPGVDKRFNNVHKVKINFIQK